MNREAGSHVLDNGVAKISYESRAQAIEIANVRWAADGKPRNVYKCAQRPEHYHIGHGIADLQTKGKP